MANQIFCFQIKRTPWMGQLMAQFFPENFPLKATSLPELNEALAQFFAELRTENEKGCLDNFAFM